MTDRDLVVSRALASLDVPDHGPRFWHDLDTLLDEATRPATPALVAVPDASIDLDIDPIVVALEGNKSTKADRSSRLWWLPVAAAFLLVAGVGVQMLSERDETGPTLGTDGTTTAAPVETTTSISAPPPAADPAEAQAAVLAFVDALGAGDVEVAASMLGPRSEAFLDSLNDPDFLHIVAGEGFGAWGRSTDRQAFTIEMAPGSAVVVLQGTLEREGMVEFETSAIPVQHSESSDTWFVDLWAFKSVDDQLLSIEPPADESGVRSLSVGQSIVVPVPAAGTVYFSLDGAEAEAVPSEAGQPVEWKLSGVAASDQSVLTVAFISNDGAIFTAEAMPVRITG